MKKNDIIYDHANITEGKILDEWINANSVESLLYLAERTNCGVKFYGEIYRTRKYRYEYIFSRDKRDLYLYKANFTLTGKGDIKFLHTYNRKYLRTVAVK